MYLSDLSRGDGTTLRASSFNDNPDSTRCSTSAKPRQQWKQYPQEQFLVGDSLHFLQPLRAHGSIKGAILGNTHQTTPVFTTICFTAAHISSRLTDISSDMPHGPSATTCPYRTITSQRKLITSLMMPRFEYYIDLLLSILPPPIQAPHTPSRLFNYHTLG